MHAEVFACTSLQLMTTQRPAVLFVCVHNAGRSQMAAGYLQHLAGDRVEVLSAGSEPAAQVNAAAVAAMAEDGIDIAGKNPGLLTDSDVQTADVVITMGCGDACPFYPGKRYEDWDLDDPAGLDLEHVRPIRDEIRKRVEQLIVDLHAAPSENPMGQHEGLPGTGRYLPQRRTQTDC
jgi:arsenate reductase